MSLAEAKVGGRFEVRTMTREAVDFAAQLAAKEGWNPGLHDAECFFETDREGFLVGRLDGRPIGCISAVSYGGVFGFVGLYIVVPEHRGQGFGIALWQRAMERLRGHNIGLDGVVAQQENYQRSGFKLAYRNVRFAGKATGAAMHDGDVVTLAGVSFDEVAEYDVRFFPVRRDAFLKPWLRMRDATAAGFLQNGRLAGYGVIRRCLQGHKIGPLFADDDEIAERLLLRLAGSVPAADDIILDVPEVNPGAVRLAKHFAMTKVFETARMYTGDAPAMNLRGVFGVTTFELG